MMKVCITNFLYNGYIWKIFKTELNEAWWTEMNERILKFESKFTMYCMCTCMLKQLCVLTVSDGINVRVHWKMITWARTLNASCVYRVVHCTYSVRAANVYCIQEHPVIPWENEIIANNFTKLNHHNYRLFCFSFIIASKLFCF